MGTFSLLSSRLRDGEDVIWGEMKWAAGHSSACSSYQCFFSHGLARLTAVHQQPSSVNPTDPSTNTSLTVTHRPDILLHLVHHVLSVSSGRCYGPLYSRWSASTLGLDT